jgi:GT2 family glycosyltransferase
MDPLEDNDRARGLILMEHGSASRGSHLGIAFSKSHGLNAHSTGLDKERQLVPWIERTSDASLEHVSVVIVLYNSEDVIEDCLASIPEDVEVIVVDNASTDNAVALTKRVRSDAVVIRSERNRGFGGGCNLGWAQATRSYIAFVNPDVRLRAGALETMLERLLVERNGIVGPAMFDAGGVARRCNRRPRALYDIIWLLPSSPRWVPPRWDGNLPLSHRIHREGGHVSHVAGACFLVRRTDLEAIGGFDEDFFLYSEEESIALRLARLGGRAVYEPTAEVEHIGGHSTGPVGQAATRQHHRSRVLLYRKRDGNIRGLLSAGLWASALVVSGPVAAVNSVTRRPRGLTLGYVWNALLGIGAGAIAKGQSSARYRET